MAWNEKAARRPGAIDAGQWTGARQRRTRADHEYAGASAGEAVRDLFRRDGFAVRSVREEGFSTQGQSKCRGDCEVVLGKNMGDAPGDGRSGLRAGRLE